jgi:hypothetical protein
MKLRLSSPAPAADTRVAQMLDRHVRERAGSAPVTTTAPPERSLRQRIGVGRSLNAPR